jgi:hypothetical protein
MVFLTGLFLGAMLGLLLMALLAAGKREGDAREKTLHKI